MANRGFLLTLIALLLGGEILLRAVPEGPPWLFRTLYGNSLSMYMEVTERLEHAALRVRVLALGDSLAMTQFQPDVFADVSSLPKESVFNASYSGMSFPSQERLLRSIGLENMPRLDRVLFFLNPSRLAAGRETNTQVFRVAIPDPSGPWREAWTERKVGPIFDYSRLYGLSRHLVLSAWRMGLSRKIVWDHIEFLQPTGGVAFPGSREDPDPPVYPYSLIDDLSEERVAEMKSVIRLLRSHQVEVVLLPSAAHPSIDPFVSADAARRFRERVEEIASRTGATFLPDAVAGFSPERDTDFCDYGHMNRSGGIAFTRWLAERNPELGD